MNTYKHLPLEGRNADICQWLVLKNLQFSSWLCASILTAFDNAIIRMIWFDLIRFNYVNVRIFLDWSTRHACHPIRMIVSWHRRLFCFFFLIRCNSVNGYFHVGSTHWIWINIHIMFVFYTFYLWLFSDIWWWHQFSI